MYIPSFVIEELECLQKNMGIEKEEKTGILSLDLAIKKLDLIKEIGNHPSIQWFLKEKQHDLIILPNFDALKGFSFLSHYPGFLAISYSSNETSIIYFEDGDVPEDVIRKKVDADFLKTWHVEALDFLGRISEMEIWIEIWKWVRFYRSNI